MSLCGAQAGTRALNLPPCSRTTRPTSVRFGVHVVPKAGLEPARALARHPLKMVCLPSSTTSAPSRENVSHPCRFVNSKEWAARCVQLIIKHKKLMIINDQTE